MWSWLAESADQQQLPPASCDAPSTNALYAGGYVPAHQSLADSRVQGTVRPTQTGTARWSNSTCLQGDLSPPKGRHSSAL